MEEIKNTSECNCDGNCCPPPKKNPWKKVLFFIVILAALAIVAFKLTTKEPAKASTGGDSLSTHKVASADSAKEAACGEDCGSSGNSSCCQEAKK